MPEDANIELLEVVHGIQSGSTYAQELLERLINGSHEGMFPMLVETAELLKALLAVQSKVIANLTEANQQIADLAQTIADEIAQQ